MLNLNKVKKLLIPEIKLTEDEKNDEAKIIKKQNSHIETLLISQSILDFVRDKLKGFSHKGVFVFFMLIKVMITLSLCIGVLTVINFGLYKLSPDHFDILRENPVTVFDFLVYSFYSLFPDGVYVKPTSHLAWTVKMISSYIGVVIIGIFLVSATSIVTTNYEKAIDEVIRFSEEQVHEIEKYLRKSYSVSKKGAISRLKEAESSIVGLLEMLYSVTNNSNQNNDEM